MLIYIKKKKSRVALSNREWPTRAYPLVTPLSEPDPVNLNPDPFYSQLSLALAWLRPNYIYFASMQYEIREILSNNSVVEEDQRYFAKYHNPRGWGG